jgi:hypothetical protein
MNMNPKKIPLRLLIVVLSALAAPACEKEVILDLLNRQGQYLIVEGNIDNLHKLQMIRLYSSGSFYDLDKGLPVTGATVTVSDGKTEYPFVESIREDNKGNYYNTEISKPLSSGGIFHLTVKQGNKTYTASSELRPVPPVDSVTVSRSALSRVANKHMYDVFIHYRNLPVAGNFYLVDLYVNGKLRTYSPARKTVISDENQARYESLYVTTLRGQELIAGDSLVLEMRSISRKQYDFYSNFFSQTALSGNPFAGAPPANIPTNLSEGARGFFQVSAVSTATKVFCSDPK